MRFAFGTLFSVTLLALALGCGKKDSTSGSSSGGGASLEGTYKVVGMEMGDEKLPDTDLDKMFEGNRMVKFSGDKMIATKMGKDDPMTFKTDSSKTPYEIDLTDTKASGKSETNFGIYKVEGDTLTICVSLSDKVADRPKEFKPIKGKAPDVYPTMIMVLQKQK